MKAAQSPAIRRLNLLTGPIEQMRLMTERQTASGLQLMAGVRKLRQAPKGL
jgi:hypothetical protein